MNLFRYIREYYKVPAKRLGAVTYRGRLAKITSAHGPHLRIKFVFGSGSKRPLVVHPTDPALIYLKPCQCEEFDYCETHGSRP